MLSICPSSTVQKLHFPASLLSLTCTHLAMDLLPITSFYTRIRSHTSQSLLVWSRLWSTYPWSVLVNLLIQWSPVSKFLFLFSTALRRQQKILACFLEDKLSTIYLDLQIQNVFPSASVNDFISWVWVPQLSSVLDLNIINIEYRKYRKWKN